MLSLGAVAVEKTKTGWVEHDEFSANFHKLPFSKEHPDTMKWWRGFPEAYNATRVNCEEPIHGMERFVDWVYNLPGRRVVFVAYPAGFDWPFVYYYMKEFATISPFGFSCLDMKSYAMAKLNVPFRGVSKRSMPKEWFTGLPEHTHVALDDAREQAALFQRMYDYGDS